MIRAATDGRFLGNDIAEDGATIAGCSAKGAPESPQGGVEGSNPSRSTIIKFECDGCYLHFPIECSRSVGREGGWLMCEGCAARDAEPLDPMRGVEFPFAENH